MKAIEFLAKAKQGKVEIPQEYLDQVTGEFRVILLLNQEKSTKKRKGSFKALSVKTKGFKFNRDEIYYFTRLRQLRRDIPETISIFTLTREIERCQ